MTDSEFHRQLVNLPNGQTACALLHAHDHALPNSPLASSTKASLTQYARLSPQELDHFDAYIQSNGSLETPLSNATKQKIVTSHEAYGNPKVWSAIKDWPSTRGEIVRTKNQLLEDSNYAQQQSRLKGPDGSSFDNFAKREAKAIERAGYNSPNEIEFGSTYQLGKYQDAANKHQQKHSLITPAAAKEISKITTA